MDGTVRLTGYQIIEQLYSGSRTQVYRAVRECDRQKPRYSWHYQTLQPGNLSQWLCPNEVHKPIVQWHGYFIKGKFDQYNRNIPLNAFVQAFRDLMGQLLNESDAQLKHWKTQILDIAAQSHVGYRTRQQTI